jgi:hypothetical protein
MAEKGYMFLLGLFFKNWTTVILHLFRSGTNKHSQVTVPGLPYKMVGGSSGAAGPLIPVNKKDILNR